MLEARTIEQPRRLERARILLVDDHPILRESFGQLLDLEADLSVCGQAGNMTEALQLMEVAQPDLMVVDIELNGATGIDLIKAAKARHPQLAILALSVHDELLYAERVLRAGASGYVMKQSPIHEVMNALRTVLSGRRYLSSRMQARVLEKFATASAARPAGDLERLSDRELEVFQLIGAGTRTRDIAERLGLSVKTVETHRAHIIEKLQLRDTIQLIRYAVQKTQLRHSSF